MLAAQTRFFVALLPPVEVQVYAESVIKELEQRYHTRTAKAPPHITLQPPFLWSAAARLESDLECFAKQQPALPIQLSGFAAFAPRVLYINVLKTPELLRLQTTLTESLEKLGIVDSTIKRPFVPHLTVASRNLTRQTFQQAWVELQSRSVEFEFVIARLTLLIYQNQSWQVQAEFPLCSTTQSG